ncbi:hypothetical protein SAMN05446935_9749 [Burkholderia sp. YR290]|nr:hypothetical protein SAMN05446934_6653 [Paraburkholderia hospita]SOE90455.1 hypothetical protein SAMN05446935_9749 [Burkholderia sp. YR290]
MQANHAFPIQTALHGYLTAIGLPWSCSRGSLKEKFGTRQHAAYSWEVIEIPTPLQFVRGLLWPLSAQVFPQFSAAMPATEFSGNAYFGDYARDNLQRTVEQLVPVLGEGKTTRTSNTLGHEWSFGPASVELYVWPPEMQQFPATNPAHLREPRLRVACHIDLKTGYRRTCSAKDKVAIERFVPVAPIPGDLSAMRRAQCRPAPQSELEFIRLLDGDVDTKYGWIGRSDDYSALVSFGSELYVVQMDDVIRFEVVRVHPAKGPGGSWLQVQCRSTTSQNGPKNLTICEAEGPDDLSALAATIASAIGKPFALLPYASDC